MDSFTGTKMTRPEFDKLLEELKAGDTLVVAKLDRFARSVSQASDLITKLIDDGIRVNVSVIRYFSEESKTKVNRHSFVRTRIRRNIDLFIGFVRVTDIFYGFINGCFDSMDFCVCHISFINSFTSFISS